MRLLGFAGRSVSLWPHQISVKTRSRAGRVSIRIPPQRAGGAAPMRPRGPAPSLPVMFKRIIVGFAGDQGGRDAVTLAARFAAALHSDLTVVYPFHPLLASIPVGEAERHTRKAVERITAAVEDAPPAAYCRTSGSWPIHALHELASEQTADLIVFGAAREGLGEHLHISTMERMVHGAPCAVAVAPAGYQDTTAATLHEIGVGFSASGEGRRALHLAHELAGMTGGRLEVIACSALSPALASYAFSSASLPALENELYAETKVNLERVVSELDGNVPVELQVIRGEPSSVLVGRSDKLDLLMLGSRAYGPLRHALLGSVSADVMRDAHCPVLVIPRDVLAGNDGTPSEPRASASVM